MAASSIKPNKPTILAAERSSSGDVCNVKIKFPKNIDVGDTYEYFVSYLTVKRKKSLIFVRV